MKFIGPYKIERIVEKNSQGITYEAINLDNNNKVLIYEYFPFEIASRDTHSNLIVPEESKLAVYKYLMEDFIEIFSLLENLPEGIKEAAPKVREILKFNNTVYGVVDYWQGETLEDYLARYGGKITLDELKAMISPVVELLGYIHKKGRLHRGICPENLILTGEGHLLLVGFVIPAMRTTGGELAPEIYGSYTAPEQFNPSQWQDISTDIYGFAATCFRAVTGASIIDTRLRRSDTLEFIPITDSVDSYVFEAMQRGTSLKKQNRQNSIQQFWDELTGISMPRSKEEMVIIPEIVSTKKLDIASLIIGTFILAIGLLWLRNIVTYEDIKIPPIPVESTIPSEAIPPILQIVPVAPNFVGRHVDNVLHSYNGEYVLIPEWEFNEHNPHGLIMAQDLHGVTEDGKEQLWLLVSRGSEWTTVPNLIGKTEKEATEILLGLDIPYQVIPMIDVTSRTDTIIEISPDVNDIISKKTDVITIYSSK